VKLTDAQRRAIGTRVGAMREIISQLSSHVELAPQLQALASELDEVERRCDFDNDRPADNVHVLLAQLLVAAHELRPRRLAAYGTVDESNQKMLELQAERVIKLAGALADARAQQA
jgi:hypothetical protein